MESYLQPPVRGHQLQSNLLVMLGCLRVQQPKSLSQVSSVSILTSRVYLTNAYCLKVQISGAAGKFADAGTALTGRLPSACLLNFSRETCGGDILLAEVLRHSKPHPPRARLQLAAISSDFVLPHSRTRPV